MGDKMNKKNVIQFQARIHTFRKINHVTTVYKWKHNKPLSNNVTMKMFEQIALMAYHVLEGLVTPEVYQFYCRLWRFIVSVSKPLTSGMFQEIQREARKLVEDGIRVFPVVFDKPAIPAQ